MLLLNPVENSIITYLAQHGSARISQIKDFLDHKKRDICQAQLYNIIHKLYTNQCLTKHGPIVSLNTKRIHERESLINQFHENNNTSHIDRTNLRQKTFYAQSLYELDPLWNNMFHTLVALQPGEDIYFYGSHHYFILSSPDLEGDFARILKEKAKVFFLVGNDCLGDRVGKQRYRERAGIETLCSTHHSFPREGYVLNIIGDYMIECVLPKELSDAYRDLFVREDLTSEELAQQCKALFMMDYQCKLIVRQHKIQASNYKNSIFKSLKKRDK